MEPLINLQGVTKVFLTDEVETHALAGIDLAVERGEYVSIAGPSGCGKSTLLSILGLLDTPSKGSYALNSRQVAELSPSERARVRNREIGFIFQSFNLIGDLSVFENVELPLTYRGMGGAERRQRVQSALERVGMAHRAKHLPSQLSGGQQQRVALGRAVVAETAVCLMDEPLSNLDAQLRGDMRREIRALQRRLGITMLYVTHDQVEAMTMADRVILMRAGHIEQNGTPASLYEQPETAFVARFIGAPAMNVLPARVLAKCPELLADMPAGHNPESLIVGVRPESVALARGGLQARIIAAEYLGADTQVETRVDEEMIMVRLPGRLAAPPGANIYLKWRPQDSHWFDASSQRRIAGK